MKKKNIEIVKKFILDNPGLNYSGIATKIQASGKINRSHRTLRLYVADVLAITKSDNNDSNDSCGDKDVESLSTESEGIEFVADTRYLDTPMPSELDVPEETKKEDGEVPLEDDDSSPENDVVNSVVFSNDNYKILYEQTPVYILNYSSTLTEISVGIVDKTFLAHSRSGLNLTEQQTIKLLGLSEIEFKTMKARLSLCKDSDSVGPYTTLTRTPEEVFELIGLYAAQLLEELSDVDDPLQATLIRETKKQLILAQNKNILFKSFIKELKEHISTIKVHSLLASQVPDVIGAEISAVVSDLHLGVISDKFNMKIAEEKLAEIASNINAFSSVRSDIGVNIILPGDIMHNISGYMHVDAFKNTETGMWGAEAIIKPYELLFNFLLSVKNLKAVYIVGGNHDRMNGDFKQEKTAEGAKLLAYMLSATLPKPITTEFNARVIKFDSGKLRFIIQHGDLKADKKSKVEEVAWKHGNSDMFNLVLVGHKHTRIIASGDDTYMARRMGVPGFGPSDNYAKDCGYDNNPGFLIIQEKGGRPAVIDIPLNY